MCIASYYSAGWRNILQKQPFEHLHFAQIWGESTVHIHIIRLHDTIFNEGRVNRIEGTQGFK